MSAQIPRLEDGVKPSGIRKLETGVPGLDILTHGGIPEGRSTLVVGRAGTGKTILGLQTLAHLAPRGVTGLLLAVEESPDDLVVSGDSLGLGLSGLIREGKLHISDATQPMDGPVMVSGDYDISGLVHRIQSVVKRTDARLVVLDSATALFSPRPPDNTLRNLFFQLVFALRKMELTALILAEAPSDYGDRLTTLGVEDYVCDAVIIMRNTPDGQRRRRSIEVNKYRRSAHYKGEYPCTITAHGLAVFPLDATERPDSPAVTVWVSSALRPCLRRRAATPIMNCRNPFSDEACSMDEMLSSTIRDGSNSSMCRRKPTRRSSRLMASG